MVARGVFWQNERTNFCIEKHGSAIAYNRYRVYILIFFKPLEHERWGVYRSVRES